MSTLSTKDEKQISELIKQGGGEIHPGENTTNNIDTDPLFKDIDSEKKSIIDKAVKQKIKSLSLDENVDTDSTIVPGQNYALISIVAPNSNQKHDSICLKIKGVFDKVEDAKAQAEFLQKLDDTFDIYIVEMYKWLLVPPDPELLEQIHVDKKLNEIIAGHREDQLKSKMYFEERKRELIENINIENEKRKEQNELDKQNNIVDDTPPDHTPTLNIETLLSEKLENNLENKSENNLEDEPLIEELNIGANNSKSVQNQILGNCPNSVESSTPSEIMQDMVKLDVVPNPSNRWADEVEK